MASFPPSTTGSGTVLTHALALLLQALAYGIYITVTGFSWYLMFQRGLRTHGQKVMFWIMLVMAFLSTAYFAVSFMHLMQLMLAVGSGTLLKFDYGPICNSIILVNYLLAVGVICWRMYVLCSPDYMAAAVINITLFVLASMSVVASICIRILFTVLFYAGVVTSRLTRALDYSVMMSFILILATNIFATVLICLQALRNRSDLTEFFQKTRGDTAQRLRTLLVESGLIYCISTATLIGAYFIRLPRGTVGDIYSPMNVQLAALYPVFTFIVVIQQRSLNGSYATTTAASSSFRTPASSRHRIESKIQLRTNPGMLRTRESTPSFMTKDPESAPAKRQVTISTDSRHDHGHEQEADSEPTQYYPAMAI